MTKAEKKKWIKKFKCIAIQKQKDWGASIDEAFTKLYDTMSDCIHETDIVCFSDCLPYDIYFDGEEDDDEVTEMIANAIDNTATWRDIAIMLDTADWDRKVFMLSDDGRLYAVTDDDFYETRDAIIEYIDGDYDEQKTYTRTDRNY